MGSTPQPTSEMAWFRLAGASLRMTPPVYVCSGSALSEHAMGPRAILVTSLIHPGTPEDEIELLASVDGRAWLATTPRLALSVSGAGDAIAALFFAHYARSRAGDLALARAASSIYGLLRHTHAAGGGEIRLVDAQDEFVRPSHAVAVRALD